MQATMVDTTAKELLASPLVSVRQAAAFLSISVSKLYMLMEQGQLPFVKIGKSRRVRREDLQALINRSLHGAQEGS